MRAGRQERRQFAAHLVAHSGIGDVLVIDKACQLQDERLMSSQFILSRCLGAGPGLTPEIGDPIIDHPQTVVRETQQLQA